MADVTLDQIAKVVEESMFGSRGWANAGREFAKGYKEGSSGFSSSNTIGRAGSRGDDARRDAETSLKTEIKLKKLVNTQNEKTSKMLKRFASAVEDVHPRMKTFGRDINTIASTLDTHFEQINKRFESAAEEIAYWEKKTSKAGRTIFDLDNKVKSLNKKLDNENATAEEKIELEKELIDVQRERAEILEKTNPKMRELLANVAKVSAALGAGAIQAGGQMMADIQSQRRYGTPGSMMQQFGAAFLGGELEGIDPQLLNELMATNRAAVIAMGGTENLGGVYARLGENINELVDLTGDRPAALKFQLESMQTLVRAGIKPTEAALKDQVNSLEFMQEALGMTSEEFTELQGQLVTNADFRRTLNGLSEKERLHRLRRLNDQIAINRANGMMRDNAIAAAQALEELAGKGPRDRFKEMAKMQALGAMAGVRMSEEARKAYIMGASATGDQREAQQRFLSTLGNALTEIRSTMGGTGTEIGIFSAMENMGISMDQFDSSLTNLGDQIKMGEGPKAFQEGFKRMVEQMGPFENAVNEATKKLEALGGVVSNVAGGGLMQHIGTAIATYLGVRGLGGIKGLMSGARGVGSWMFGKGKGAVTGAARLVSAIPGLGGAGATAVGSAGAGAVLGSAGAGLAAGGLLGTAINNFGKLFGGRQLSTVILDKFTNFNEYDPNADVVANKTADSTEKLVAPTQNLAETSQRQLTMQEKIYEASLATAEAVMGGQSAANAAARISNLQSGQQFRPIE